MARDVLWEIAATQHGFVTSQQAADAGVSNMALLMLGKRGTLERTTHGVYRFPRFPDSPYDPFMAAVLWARVPAACLSHETALAVYEICDVNPNVIHITVPKRVRLRRANPDGHVVHHQDLDPSQIGWWQEIPTVTATTAIAQCVAFGTPTYLLRQALERGRRDGHLTSDDHDRLTRSLEDRHG